MWRRAEHRHDAVLAVAGRDCEVFIGHDVPRTRCGIGMSDGDARCRHRHSSLILPPVGLHPAAPLAGEQSVRSVFQVSPCASEEKQV